jgi:N-acetyl-gamma-glutamyl-phosphate reductase
MQHAPALLEAGVRVVDLAADFPHQGRLATLGALVWHGACGACAGGRGRVWAAGDQPRRDSRRAAGGQPRLLSDRNDLGLLPLLESDADRSLPVIIADVKSGVSGAGRKANAPLLMAEVGESFKAYSVAGHRHEPEI